MNFYTNVQVNKGKILYRGIQDGKRTQVRLDYAPSLFVPSNEPNSEYRTLKGDPLQRIDFTSISKAKKFISDYTVSGTSVYGMRRFEYSFIHELYQNNEIHFDKDQIQIDRIDIETASENGFPEPDTAEEEITAITVRRFGVYHSFGARDYVPHRSDVVYHHCKDEIDMLQQFLAWWSMSYPDVLTGWNAIQYDVQYLVNRYKRLFGDKVANRLSPWDSVFPKNYTVKGAEVHSYCLLGIALMDSIDLYRRFSKKGMSQDSYALDNIAQVELGKSKLDYSEHGKLHLLYKHNYQKYMEYNITDVELDHEIAEKYNVLGIALTIAYMNKVNLEDVFMQVRMWAAIVNNVLIDDKIALDHDIGNEKADYSGGFVLAPQVGMFDWVVSYDLRSLYPHLIMQYNISPETLVEPENYTDEMRAFLSQNITVDRLLNREIDTSVLKKLNLTVTPNGQLFRTDFQGFLPKLMEKMFNDRNENKKKQLEAESDAEKTHDLDVRAKFKALAAKYESLQMALKVCLNSAYGAFGSIFFVLYDVRQAEAITSAGRLAIKWIGKTTNDKLRKMLGTNKDYILAQDTDSMYLTLADFVNTSFATIPDDLNKVVDFLDKVSETYIVPKIIEAGFNDLRDYTNAYSQKMFMKREKIASRGFWTGKKRYGLNVYDSEGVRYDEPKIAITGGEAVRSSTPKVARKAIKDFVKIVLTKTEKDAQKFIADFKAKYPDLPIEDTAIPTGVNGLDTYHDPVHRFKPKCPMHVRAAIVHNEWIAANQLEKEYETIKNNTKIKYVFLREPNQFHSDVIAWEGKLPEELDIMDIIDYNTLFNRAFFKPVDTIMSAIGWQAVRKPSLKAFFK